MIHSTSQTISFVIKLLDLLIQHVFDKVEKRAYEFILPKFTQDFTQKITWKVIDNYLNIQKTEAECQSDPIPKTPGLDMLVPIKVKIQPKIKTATNQIKIKKIQNNKLSNQTNCILSKVNSPRLIKIDSDSKEDSIIQQMRRRKIRREGNANQTLQDIYALINQKKQLKRKTELFQFTSDYDGKKLYFNKKNSLNPYSPIFNRIIVKDRIIDVQDPKNRSRQHRNCALKFSHRIGTDQLYNIASHQNKFTNINDILNIFELKQGVQIDYQKSSQFNCTSNNFSSKLFNQKENLKCIIFQSKSPNISSTSAVTQRRRKFSKHKETITKYNHQYINQILLNQKMILQHYYTQPQLDHQSPVKKEFINIRK